jgi:hypothetical protein
MALSLILFFRKRCGEMLMVVLWKGCGTALLRQRWLFSHGNFYYKDYLLVLILHVAGCPLLPLNGCAFGVDRRWKRKYTFSWLVRWRWRCGPLCTLGLACTRRFRVMWVSLFKRLDSLLNVKRVRRVWCWFGKRLLGAYGKRGMLSYLKEEMEGLWNCGCNQT